MDGVTRTTASPYRILTICTGNICRSPMAEFLLREALEEAGLGDRVQVDSAGVSDEEEGNPADPRTIAELRRRGHADHGWSEHVARQVEPDWIGERDLVLAATRYHAHRLERLAPHHEDRIRVIREFDPESLARGDLDMDDPWYGGRESFEQTYEEVVAAIPGIVDHVRGVLDARPRAGRRA